MSGGSLAQRFDGSAIDRRLDIRYVGAINGCYTLAGHRSDEGVEVFACRVQSISPSAVAVTAPVKGAVGATLTAKLEGLGIFRGHVVRPLQDGFVFEITATETERLALARQIDWLKRHRVKAAPDKRQYRRVQPRDPRSTVTLDGKTMRCHLIDLSRSGAAVSADCSPAVGSPIVLGGLSGKVIRSLKVGFAVAFDEIQPEGFKALPPAAPKVVADAAPEEPPAAA